MSEEELQEEVPAEEEEVAEEGEEAAEGEEAVDEAADEEAVEADDGEPAAEEDEEMGEDEMPADPEASPPAEEEAAPEEEAVPEEEAAPEEELDEEEQVEEHLKDAIEGSLKLKRLLEQDSDAASKKLKTNTGAARETCDPQVAAKSKQLMMKWGLQLDAGVRHVLEHLPMESLTTLQISNFIPDKNHPKRTPSELVSQHLLQMQERKMVAGTKLDVVSAFKFRWSLDMMQEKKLRELNHKDLRYVLTNFDKTVPLDDVISEAALEQPDETSTLSAAPQAAGVKAVGRFNRLELIDPLADCAVFGDANLTFSINLARHRKFLGHVGRVIATTFEEIEVLRERYKEIDETVVELEDHDAEVYHGVDCTRVAIDSRFKGMEDSLGAVYYNFPHSGAVQGFFDSHPLVNWRHENLMRLFFRALRTFVKPGGSVKVSSNAGAVGVRYSYIVGSALENEFLHVESMPFLEWHLHRYGRSYGDRRDVYKRPDAKNNQSYNAQNANSDMVYCFCYAPTGKSMGPAHIKLPPTLKTLQDCKDGPFANMVGPAKAKLAQQLHKRFVTEVTGTHVG
jgi:hypothetical protein